MPAVRPYFFVCDSLAKDTFATSLGSSRYRSGEVSASPEVGVAPGMGVVSLLVDEQCGDLRDRSGR